MVPGFTTRECQLAELRRQELLATAARQRRLVELRLERPRNRASVLNRLVTTLFRERFAPATFSHRHTA